MSKIGQNAGRKKLITLALSVLVLPLLIIVAFSASLNITATTSPLFNLGTAGQSYGGTYEVTTAANSSLFTITINYTAPPQSTGQQGLNFSLPRIPATYLVAMIVVLFVIVTFGIVRNLRSGRVTTEFEAAEASDDDSEQQEQRAEVSQALDDAISKLRQGSDYREAVLECYRRIVSILEAKSEVEGTWMTPREFEKVVSDRLGLHDNPYLSQATKLFEVARYSEHEVSKAEADSAVDCLSNLSGILKQGHTKNPD